MGLAVDAPPPDAPSWYENAIIYQVPTALLKDTNGNGFGDLRGVTQSLSHIAELGANAIWMQPFYSSPFVDGGYDVVDHRSVSDRFGTMLDFEDMMRRAQELGLEVILDLVIQHTSEAHPWFREACRDPGSKYRDYFIWADEPHDTIVEPVFPTVHDSVWTWHEEAGQYYRHTFYAHEPDLNVANPEVRAEILRIMDFWLDHGVAGFRVDAVPYLIAEAAQADPRDDGFWLLEDMRRTLRAKRPDGVLIAEADVEPDEYPAYFGSGDRFTMLLNFWLNNHLFLALARGEAEPLVRALKNQPQPPEGCQYATWLRNHDELDLERLTPAEREETMAVFAPEPQMRIFGRGIRRRLAPMLGEPRRLKLALFLLCSLPGTPVLLYGDEIGLGENLGLPDRAAVRSPMQWSDEPNAGFSDADSIQLLHPVIDEGPFSYRYVNVADQSRHPDSPLETLKRLFALRRELGPFRSSTVRSIPVTAPGVLALRHDDGAVPVLMLANLESSYVDAELPGEDIGDWVEVAADHDYEPTTHPRTVHLHGYGWRWFRLGH